MKIAIVANCGKPKVRASLDELLPWIRQHSDVVAVDTDAAVDLAEIGADVLLIFGGDGTLLSAARRLRGRPVPIMGVNYGRLGFLASFTPDQFKENFERLVANKLPVSSRLVLEASVICGDQPCVLEDPKDVEAKRIFVATALNDVVISAGAPFRMIELMVGPLDDPGVRFLGDGIIISTPSGSTAYSMSAGGPILSPGLDAICVTPICPQSLSFRPIVVSSHTPLLATTRRVNVGTTLICDGQANSTLKPGDTVLVRRAKHDVRLVENPDSREWRTLAEKLNWAASPLFNATAK